MAHWVSTTRPVYISPVSKALPQGTNMRLWTRLKKTNPLEVVDYDGSGKLEYKD